MCDVDEDSEAGFGLSGKEFCAGSPRSVVGTDWEQVVSKFFEILPWRIVILFYIPLLFFKSFYQAKLIKRVPICLREILNWCMEIAGWLAGPRISRGMRPHKDPYVAILMAPFYRLE